MAAHRLRDERLLVDGRFAGGDGLLREDLRNLRGVFGEVVAALADAGDVFQQLRCRNRRRTATVETVILLDGHLLGDPLEVAGGRDAVGQDDDVLQLGRRRHEDVVRLFHGGVHRRAAAGFDAGDVVADAGLVLGGLHLADDVGLAVERDDADLVVLAQQFDRAAGGGLGHLDLLAAHRAGLVDDEHHAEAGLFLFLLEVAADGQDFFERRLVIAAEAERLLAAEHDESAAQLLHVGAGDVHLLLRERRRRDVGENQQFVVLQIGQCLGHPLRRADVGLDAFVFERVGQFPDQAGIAFDDQHARLPAGEDEAGLGVVVEQRVGLQFGDADGERGEAFALDRLLEPEPVLPLDELAALADHLVIAAIDFEEPFVVVIGMDDDLDVERLAFADLGRDADLGDLHFRLGAGRQRNGRDGHAAADGGLQGIAGGFVAVGEQHDVRDVAGREIRGGGFDRGGDVGPLARIDCVGGGRGSCRAGVESASPLACGFATASPARAESIDSIAPGAVWKLNRASLFSPVSFPIWSRYFVACVRASSPMLRLSSTRKITYC